MGDARSELSEAEALFGDHRIDIDLLLTDVVMPEMNGPQLYRRLAKEKDTLRVLFMSGYPQKPTAQSAEADVGANFLQKPFTSLQLARKVREVLSR